MTKAVVVDDERLARAELKRLLKVHKDVEIIGEFNKAQELLDYLEGGGKPDVVFLDIQMPGLSGLQAAKKIGKHIKFVFSTAHTEFAVEAFELEAVDYLLKPISADRLAQALERCKPIDQQRVDYYLADDYRLLLRFGDVQHFVRLDQIERFEVVGNDTALYTPHGKSYLRSPLVAMAKRLNPSIFFKANRSEMIRVDQVKQLEPGVSTGSIIAVMNSGAEVKISRRQSSQLKELFYP